MNSAEQRQTTLARSLTRRGVGMHSGIASRVSVSPAPAGSGIRFRVGGTTIPARAALVSETNRCTSLSADGARVDTVEHLLSALFGLQIDNADVDVEGPEVPILDGSALPWAQAILEAGRTELDEPADVIRPDSPLVIGMGDSWLVASPAPRLTITCVTRFDHPLLGVQAASVEATPDTYIRDVAPARTFGFAEEVERLLARGLARGGSLDNAVVVYQDRFSSPLRLDQECLRHKLLDLFGDLSLAGGRIAANITAIMPGHGANVALATSLADLAGCRPAGS